MSDLSDEGKSRDQYTWTDCTHDLADGLRRLLSEKGGEAR